MATFWDFADINNFYHYIKLYWTALNHLEQESKFLMLSETRQVIKMNGSGLTSTHK